jgi:hypothetical protein
VPDASALAQGCDEPSGTDYASVEITSEDRSEYSYVERRAELLQLIREAGHPKALNQTQLAERYGVTQQQISKDLDRLAEYVHEIAVDRSRRLFTVNTVVDRAVRGLLNEGEWRKAAKTAMEHDEWLTEFHDLDVLASEVEDLKQTQEIKSR